MEPNLFTLQNLGTLEGKWAIKKSMVLGCLGYIRDDILPMRGLQETTIRIPIKHPGFHGK